MSHGDGEDEEQNKPSGQKIPDGRQTGCSGLEKLIQLVVARDNKQRHCHEEKLVQLLEKLGGKDEGQNDSNKSTGNCHQRIEVPGASPEPTPPQPKYPDNDIRDVEKGKDEKEGT